MIALVDRSKSKEVLKFAVPAIGESILVSLLTTVDTYMVSHLGTTSVASVALTVQPVKLFMVLFPAICTIITKTISECLGKGDESGAINMVRYAFKLTLFLSIAIAAVSIFFADGIMVISGSNSDTHAGAVLYFRIVMIGMIPSNISCYLNAVKRGCQNSKVSLVSNAASNFLNILFDYLLIYDSCGISSKGIAGAAIATLIGYTAAMIVSLLSFRSKKDTINFSSLKSTSSGGKELRKPFFIMTGTLFIELLLTRFGFAIISAITARIGTEALAVDKVAMNFLDIVYSFGSGIQAAALTMVSRSLGQNSTEDIRGYTKTTLFIGTVISGILALLFLVIGKRVVMLYFEPSEMISTYAALTSTMSAMIVLFQIPQLVLNGILRGLGKVRTTLICSMIAILIIQAGGVFLMVRVFKMGLSGKWLTSLISQAAWAAFLGWNVRRTILTREAEVRSAMSKATSKPDYEK